MPDPDIIGLDSPPPNKIPGPPYREGQYVLLGMVWAHGKKLTPYRITGTKGSMVYLTQDNGESQSLDMVSVEAAENTTFRLLEIDPADLAREKFKGTVKESITDGVLTLDDMSGIGLLNRTNLRDEPSWSSVEDNEYIIPWIAGPFSDEGEMFIDINQALQNGHLPEDPRVAEVTVGLHQSMRPLGNSRYLYRGTTEPTEDWDVGEFIPNGSFISTARGPSAALEFAQYWYSSLPSTLIEIEADPQTRGITTGEYDSSEEERETLLDFNQGLHILDKQNIMVEGGSGNLFPITYIRGRVEPDKDHPVAKLLAEKSLQHEIDTYKKRLGNFGVDRDQQRLEYQARKKSSDQYVPRRGRGKLI